MAELIKSSKNGVYLYKEGDNIVMYIEERRVMSLPMEYKNMMFKSFDNLVKLRDSEK